MNAGNVAGIVVAAAAAVAVVVVVALNAPSPSPATNDVFPISVTPAGSGTGRVTSSVPGIDCPGSCSASFPSGTKVNLTAVPAADSIFAGWSAGCEGTGGCALVVTSASAVRADFSVRGFVIAVTLSGPGSGRVTSSLPGIDCPGSCSASFRSGIGVNLTAAPAANSVFGGWSSACEGTGGCALVVTSASTVRADFIVPTLTIALSASRAGVVSDSAGRIGCPSRCEATYAPGTSVTLLAVAGAAATFRAWTGDCVGTGQCVVAMTAVRNVGATFTFTSAGGFDAAPCAAPAPVTARAGDSAAVQITACFVNTGPTAWVAGTLSEVSIGQCCPLGSSSPYATWVVRPPSPTTYARQSQSLVAPGQQALFEYAIRVPAGTPPGTYAIEGDLVLTRNGAVLHPGQYTQTVVVANVVGGPPNTPP